MLLSLWQSYCGSSLCSSDECSTAPNGCRPSDQAVTRYSVLTRIKITVGEKLVAKLWHRYWYFITIQATQVHECVTDWQYNDTWIQKNYKLKIDQLTTERLKASKLHWGRTYLLFVYRTTLYLLWLKTVIYAVMFQTHKSVVEPTVRLPRTVLEQVELCQFSRIFSVNLHVDCFFMLFKSLCIIFARMWFT